MWFSGSTLAFHAWGPQFKAQDHNERDKDTLPTLRGSPTKPSLGTRDAQCIFFPMASLQRVKWLWQSPWQICCSAYQLPTDLCPVDLVKFGCTEGAGRKTIHPCSSHPPFAPVVPFLFSPPLFK